VKINLHHHLLHNRRNSVRQEPDPQERVAFKLFAWAMNHPGLYDAGKSIARWLQPLHRFIKGTRLDPAKSWTKTRDLPPIADRTFKEYWRNRE
jgi:L-lactate dehydrogenase complex protein LldF